MKIDIVIPTLNRKGKLMRCITSILASDYQDYRLIVVNDIDSSMAFGIWNRHLLNLNADAMFYLCDDTELKPNCLRTLVDAMQVFYSDTDGVIGVNQVNIHDGSPSAMGLIGRKFAERHPGRRCFCPDYISLWADTELGEYAQSLDKFKFAKLAELTHYHPAFYPKERDETHNVVRQWKTRDQETRDQRQTKKLLWGRTFELIK